MRRVHLYVYMRFWQQEREKYVFISFRCWFAHSFRSKETKERETRTRIFGIRFFFFCFFNLIFIACFIRINLMAIFGAACFL